MRPILSRPATCTGERPGAARLGAGTRAAAARGGRAARALRGPARIPRPPRSRGTGLDGQGLRPDEHRDRSAHLRALLAPRARPDREGRPRAVDEGRAPDRAPAPRPHAGRRRARCGLRAGQLHPRLRPRRRRGGPGGRHRRVLHDARSRGARHAGARVPGHRLRARQRGGASVPRRQLRRGLLLRRPALLRRPVPRTGPHDAGAHAGRAHRDPDELPPAYAAAADRRRPARRALGAADVRARRDHRGARGARLRRCAPACQRARAVRGRAVGAMSEQVRPEGIPGVGFEGPFAVGSYAKALQARMRERARVQLFGEVWNMRRGRGAKVYFELRDGDGAVPCSMWSTDFDKLGPAADAIVDGAQIVVAGGPDYYPGSRTSSPSFSFQVTGVRVAGEGDLLAQLDRLRKAWAAEGLFEPQKALHRPTLPHTIGVVTGEGGKARDDALAGLRRRGWGGRVVWAFAPVQDRHAAPRITQALQDLAAHDEIEVI